MPVRPRCGRRRRSDLENRVATGQRARRRRRPCRASTRTVFRPRRQTSTARRCSTATRRGVPRRSPRCGAGRAESRRSTRAMRRAEKAIDRRRSILMKNVSRARGADRVRLSLQRGGRRNGASAKWRTISARLAVVTVAVRSFSRDSPVGKQQQKRQTIGDPMKAKTVFYCTECGNETPKVGGALPEPAAHGIRIVEQAVADRRRRQRRGAPQPRAAQPRRIRSPSCRHDAGAALFRPAWASWTVCSAGALCKGSLVLVGGAPGIGKSTLMLQICRQLCRNRQGPVRIRRGIAAPAQAARRAARASRVGQPVRALGDLPRRCAGIRRARKRRTF